MVRRIISKLFENAKVLLHDFTGLSEQLCTVCINVMLSIDVLACDKHRSTDVRHHRKRRRIAASRVFKAQLPRNTGTSRPVPRTLGRP